MERAKERNSLPRSREKNGTPHVNEKALSGTVNGFSVGWTEGEGFDGFLMG